MLILEENAENMLLLSTLNLVKTHNAKKASKWQIR